MRGAAAEQAYTLPEVAQILRCGLATVYRRIHAGEIKTINIGSGKVGKRGQSSKMRVLESALGAYQTADRGHQ